MGTPDGQERQSLNDDWELSKINDWHQTTDFRSSKNIQQDKYWGKNKTTPMHIISKCRKQKENFERSGCQREKNTLSTEEKDTNQLLTGSSETMLAKSELRYLTYWKK